MELARERNSKTKAVAMGNDARRNLLVGSKNKDKIAEIRALLVGLPVTVHSADAFDIPDVEETGDTFVANANLKSEAFAKATGMLTMADDSGLCVDALNGEPGVYSARWAGPGCTYADNNRKLVAALADIPPERRTAHFISVISCATPDGVLFTTEGRVDGVIADAPRGGRGFGYDPLFLVPELGRTFAELEPAEKHAISHRGCALAAFREALAKYLAGESSR